MNRCTHESDPSFAEAMRNFLRTETYFYAQLTKHITRTRLRRCSAIAVFRHRNTT